MDTRKIESLLAKKFGYKNLPGDLSEKYRAFFRENIPEFLLKSGSKALYTNQGSLLCTDYDRIVVGDYGAFVEFSAQQAAEQHFIIMPGQEYRIIDPKYANHVKYEWLTIDDGSNIKIYRQKRTVTYADYKSGMYYVSVHEVRDGKE